MKDNVRATRVFAAGGGKRDNEPPRVKRSRWAKREKEKEEHDGKGKR